MADTLVDVNTEESSSTSSASQATSATEKEASAKTSTAQGKTDAKEVTMSDIVAQVAKKHNIDMEEDSSPAKAKSEKGSVQNLNKTEEEKEKKGDEEKKDDLETKGEEKEKEKEKTEEKEETTEEETDEKKTPDPVPYDRFKEVNEKAKDFEAKYTSAEPIVKAHNQIVDFCRREGIDGKQFQEGLQMLALINKDPASAVKALSTLIEQIQGYVGDKLPEDLQKDVDSAKAELENGEISQARYEAYVNRAKELAQLRAQSRLGQQRQQKEQQTAQQRLEQENLRTLTSTAKAWEEQRMTKDPDFRPNSEKYNMVQERFFSLARKVDEQGRAVHPITSAAEVNKLLTLSYDQISSFLSKGKARPNRQKILTSTGSSTNAELDVDDSKSSSEVMNMIKRKVAQKHGIAV